MNEQDPSRLGPYRLLRPLGAGGMGEVHLAERIGAAGVAKKVVVKRIKGLRASDALARERFVNEARIAMRLDHPNVVQVFDFGQEEAENGELYLVMEWIDGPSLFELWRAARQQGERIPFGISVFVVRGLLAGLHFAHEQLDEAGRRLGIVHRDVSPQNVLLDRSGQVKLTDFGIARARDVVSRTRPGMVRGKLVYFSPEQLSHGAVDRRTDVFAAGAVLYQLLTGSLPVKGEPETVRRLILEGGWAPASMVEPELPAELQAILERAMARDPAERFPTAEAFGAALEGWLGDAGLPVSEEDLADYLCWIDRESAPEGLARLPEGYAEAMAHWSREVPGQREDPDLGTAALPLPGQRGATGSRPAAAPARPWRPILAGLALLLGLAGLAGWWAGPAREPPGEALPEAPRGPPAPEPLPHGPSPRPAPPPATPPPAGPRLSDEEGRPILRQPGTDSLLPEGGERILLHSALSIDPATLPWVWLPLPGGSPTRLSVEGEVSLGGVVPRRLHTVLVRVERGRTGQLLLLRPGAPLELKGPGRVGLAICDPMGIDDNTGTLVVEARRGKQKRRYNVDPRRNVFRADTIGGVTLRGLRPGEHYRISLEASALAPPLFWIHPLQVGAAFTRQGEVDRSLGLLRDGEEARLFGVELLELMVIGDAPADTPYTLSIRLVPASEAHPE
ncbi:MAG: serine/threonine-protein kinase [Deltaproteobacteria bacterium]|nr:serine/threonine-protein kinase [Deltaproteobacteria bacterium]